MDEDSSSNSSAKRSKLDNLPTAATDETGEKRSDLTNMNDVEMMDNLSSGVEKCYESQREESKLEENSVPKDNENSEDNKKDDCGDGGGIGDAAGDSAIAIEDSGYAESDKKDEKTAELSDDKSSDNNDPGTSSRVKKPTKRRNRTGAKRRNYRTRVLSSSSSTSSDIDSDDKADSPIDISSKSSSSSSSESELILESDDINDNSDSSLNLHYSGFNGMDSDSSNSSNRSGDNTTPDFLHTMQKPNYNWNQYQEIMYREHGLSGKNRSSFTKANAIAFQNRYYAARHVIEKMKLLHSLQKHQGCVNSLHFNRAGNLIVSGSDDLKIILWNWSANKIAYAFNSGHNSNVFQTKFIELSSGINIVSSGRDGQIRHATIPPSGGKKASSRVLLKHSGAVHKIAPGINNPYEILTAGEDGHVIRCDLREKPIELVVTVKDKKRKVPLYSIAHHPLDQEFCVCGRDQFIRVYDKRNTKKPVQTMCPQHLEDRLNIISSCAVYNSTGSEILASYSDEDIYLFNNKCYLSGHFSHRYKGHSNNKTIKGVNFFGPNSEYVVSGSDCGNFFFWDKSTESIINWIKGDNTGVVNCLEQHPSFPILATSGLDHDVKIWAPLNNEYPPPMEGLSKCIKHNMKRSVMCDTDIFDDRTFFFFVRQCLRNRRPPTRDDNCPNVQDVVSSSSDDDGNDCGSGDESTQFRALPCTPQ